MNEQLKPCPFCGSDKLSLSMTADWHTISCLNCHGSIDFALTAEDCRSAWNKRAISETNYADALRTITLQAAEIARLRAELVAKSPPPATPPYHRLDIIPEPCEQCIQDSDDLYLLPSGDLQKLCRVCAEEHGAILAD